MSEVRYVLPRVVADKAGYEFLAELYESVLQAEAKEALINFDQCRDFHANLSAALGAILDDLTEKGYNMFINLPRERGVRRILARNKFLKAFNIETTNEDRENYIVYRCFGNDDAETFKTYILTELIQKQKFPHCSPKAKEKIIESIYELFANAVTHSGCQKIYCCGEVHPRNSKQMMDMTFVNLGTTVIENVNNFLQKRGENPETPCGALKWAFVEGNTTKTIPGGLGLAILEDFITLNEGTIQMVSGNAMLEIDNGNTKETVLERRFPGTIVNVEFNCSDQKTYTLATEDVDINDLF